MAKARPALRRKITRNERRPHVALIIETSLGSGRDILRGVARYVRKHEPWALYHEPHGLEDSVPQWLRRWNGDGIIARIQTRRIAQALAASGIPVVDVLGVVPGLPFPLVQPDNVAIAAMAAEGRRRLPSPGAVVRHAKRSATFGWRYLSADLRSMPDFVIVGAARSGTTSLYRWLGSHPDVAPAWKKEIHYFDEHYGRGMRWYRAHFPFRRRGRVTGEATPYLLFHPLSPR